MSPQRSAVSSKVWQLSLMTCLSRLLTIDAKDSHTAMISQYLLFTLTIQFVKQLILKCAKRVNLACEVNAVMHIGLDRALSALMKCIRMHRVCSVSQKLQFFDRENAPLNHNTFAASTCFGLEPTNLTSLLLHQNGCETDRDNTVHCCWQRIFKK